MKLKLETKEGVIVQDATVYIPIYCLICWSVIHVSASDDDGDLLNFSALTFEGIEEKLNPRMTLKGQAQSGFRTSTPLAQGGVLCFPQNAERCGRALKAHYDWHEAQAKAALETHRRIDHVTMALIVIGLLAALHAWCSFLSGLPR